MGEVAEPTENIEFFGGPLDGQFVRVVVGREDFNYPVARAASITVDDVSPPKPLIIQKYTREQRARVDPETLKLVHYVGMVYRGEGTL